MTQATKTPIEPGLIARLSQGVRYALTGAAPEAWFGPLEPLQPLVPDDQRATVVGRQLDYQVGYNLQTKPRHGEAVTFDQLRALADNCDILRLVIETRKDQLAKMRWAIKPRDEGKDPDARCIEAEELLAWPDKEHSWDDWLRMLLDDLLVIDAPTIYPRMTRGGKLYALEPVDGATIKRVIDEGGRTPLPPDPAYQQILKGVPAVDYTREELIYKPRNLRTYKLYGFSPVEQIVMTVNIALRRSAHIMEHYRSGNIPEALVGVPESWQPEQINQFQAYWDNIIEGDLAQRRKMKFVPGEISRNFHETKAPPMKDLFDEWLARVICFCFSIEPTPFVTQVNRAVAETSREQSLSEGLAPLQNWIKSLIDLVLRRFFDAPDLEFDWEEEQSVDPLQQAQINQIYIATKVLHPDEVRADLGMEPLTTAQKQEMNPPAPAASGDGAGPGAPQQSADKNQGAGGKEALGKAAKKPVYGPDTKTGVRAIKALRGITSRLLSGQAQAIATQIAEHANLTKAEGPQGEVRTPQKTIDGILASLDFSEWASDFFDDAADVLAGIAVDAGIEAMNELNIFDADALKMLRKEAGEWAENRAAEMVGMRVVNGELIPNPNARWQITEGTRELIRADVTEALDGGWSAQELASRLADSYAFSDDRAETIARTEIARADVEGNTAGWKATGLVDQKEWLTAEDCCDICDEMNGKTAPIDGEFEGGASVPLHPNCRCTILPIVNEDNSKDQ